MKRMSLLIVLIMVLVMGLFISCEQPSSPTTYNEPITEQPNITKVSAIADYNSNTPYYVDDTVEITWVVTLSSGITISEEPISETLSLGDNTFTYKNDNQVVIGTVTIVANEIPYSEESNNEEPSSEEPNNEESNIPPVVIFISSIYDTSFTYYVGDKIIVEWTLTMSDDTIITESETYTLVLGTNNLYYDINNQELIGGKIIIFNVIEKIIEQESSDTQEVSDTTGDNNEELNNEEPINEEPINEEPIIPTPTRTLQSISGVVSNNRDNSGTNNNYVVGDTVTITWTKHYNLAPLTETESESYTLISGDIGNRVFNKTIGDITSNTINISVESLVVVTIVHGTPTYERVWNGSTPTNNITITWNINSITYNNGVVDNSTKTMTTTETLNGNKYTFNSNWGYAPIEGLGENSLTLSYNKLKWMNGNTPIPTKLYYINNEVDTLIFSVKQGNDIYNSTYIGDNRYEMKYNTTTFYVKVEVKEYIYNSNNDSYSNVIHIIREDKKFMWNTNTITNFYDSNKYSINYNDI